MEGLINGLSDALFALVLIGAFLLFIWSRIMKKSMGDTFDGILNFFREDKSAKKMRTEVKQTWPQIRTRM